MNPRRRRSGIRRLAGVGVALLGLGLVGGCSREGMIEKFAPAAERAEAEALIDQIRRGAVDAVVARSAPEMAEQVGDLPALLAEMGAGLPDSEPVERLLGGYRSRMFQRIGGESLRRHHFVFQDTYAEGIFVYQLTLQQRGGEGPKELAGLRVDRAETSLVEVHRFTLRGRSPGHYLFLSLVGVVPIFIGLTCWSIFTGPVRGSRWLWLAVSVLGVGRFALDWTSGEVSFQLLHVQLLGAGYQSVSPLAPWFFAVSVPVGAILFHLWHFRWRKAQAGGGPALHRKLEPPSP